MKGGRYENFPTGNLHMQRALPRCRRDSARLGASLSDPAPTNYVSLSLSQGGSTHNRG